jgi:glycosyltransferase involved in cell wall biosynthesis
MKVLILTRYDTAGPSSRERFYRYLPALRTAGIEPVMAPLLDNVYVENLYAGRRTSPWLLARFYARRLPVAALARRYDAVLLEKELWPMAPAWGEWLMAHSGAAYAVDYDDAVFHNYDMHSRRVVRALLGHKIDAVMKHAAVVIAGNTYLADRARRAGARRVEILPTIIDTDTFTYAPSPNNERFTVGWVGTPLTAQFLPHIFPALQRLAARVPLRAVFVGAPPFEIQGVDVETPGWSETGEPEWIHRFDVGVMPLVDDPFDRGKCGFKLLKYMACGRAVVASPVGVNREIVNHGENGLLADTPDAWFQALDTLARDPGARARMGEAGRRMVEKSYSLKINAPRLAALLHDIAKLKNHKR